MVKQRMQNVGMYVRLSKEDLRQGESLSIENQKAILLKHVVEQGWNLVDIYIDDGYSGGNFERPGFQRMMQDVQSGLVNIILIKDMSRFGRDYIEVGRYTELVLPKLGCRQVALHDGMDTATETGSDFIPFKNLFNDFYLRDCSRKVKAGKRAMAERGKFGGSYAPYGYKLSHDENNTLLIDENVAHIVRRIYAMRVGGIGPQRIGALLTAEGVPSPSVYVGVKRGSLNSPDGVVWCDGTVRRILTNEAYIGNMVQNKTQNLSYKNKAIKHNSSEEYIRVCGTHEPIIDMETWNECQRLMQARRRVRNTKEEKPHLFAGLMVCADCGYAMSATPRTRKDGSRYVRYVCGKYSSCGKAACESHSIREDTLCELVRYDLLGHIAANPINDDELKAALQRKLNRLSKQQSSSEKDKLRALRKAH